MSPFLDYSSTSQTSFAPLRLKSYTREENCSIDIPPLKKAIPNESALHFPPTKKRQQDSQTFWNKYLNGTSVFAFPQILSDDYSPEICRGLKHTIVLNVEHCNGFEIATTVWAAWALVVSTQTESTGAIFGISLGPGQDKVPMRVDIKPCMTIAGLLQSLQETASEMASYEPIHLEDVRKLSYDAYLACRYHTIVGAQPAKDVTSSICKAVRDQPHILEPCAVHLTYSVVDQAVTFTSDFDTKLSSPAQMERLLYELGHVMTQIHHATPACTLESLDVISPQELVQIHIWNHDTSVSDHVCAHDAITAWAHTQPCVEALCAWDGTFTYGQLEVSSNHLAYYLVELGVGPEVLVPVCFERSALAVICILAVMKAGGAFVPLDPSTPQARNSEIVKQTGAKTVLVSKTQSHQWADQGISIDWDLLHGLPPSKFRRLTLVDAKSLAYVIFTSGTTGKPKGVMIEHRSLSISLACHGKTHIYGQNIGSRVLQFASPAFDASMTEHLAPLSHGGCVCIPDQQTRMGNITQFMNETRVNWAFFTPSFLKYIEPSEVPTVDTVVVGGEAITEDCIDRWAGKVKLINGYGPSETTIVATACVVLPSSTQRSSIGNGLACKTWVAVADNHDKLAPIGTVGELLIQGPTVGRGYFQNAAKTREAFMSSPKWLTGSPNGDRLYKTGDLVRYGSNGSLTYLGRKDTQVKVRGQRLELSEVEYHLSLNPEVRHAVVLFPQAGFMKKRLVAVITLRSLLPSPARNTGLRPLSHSQKVKAAVHIAGIRESISASLPSYMNPDIYAAIEAMPLTDAGKIGRAAVALWLQNISSKTYQQLCDDSAKPVNTATQRVTTDSEKVLQNVWAHVLNLPPQSIGLDVPFQALGGDSITAMQVARKANIELTVADMLKGQTISQLAAHSEQKSASRLFIAPDSKVPFGLSPIQQLYTNYAPREKHYFNQTFLLQLSEPCSPHKVSSAVNAIVHKHAMLRTRLLKDDHDKWVQKTDDGNNNLYAFHLHSITDVEESAPLIKASQMAVEPVSGPVMVIDLINVSDGSQLLSLVAHHIIVDLVSWRIIIDDLETFLRNGRLAGLSTMSYQTWSALLADRSRVSWPTSKALPYSVPLPCLAYWEMSDCENTYGEVLDAKFRLGEDTSAFILDGCHRILGCEPLDLFLSALFLSFARTFEDRALPPIFNEGHGREPWDPLIDISATVGWFTTLCPVHTRIEPQASIVETIRRIQHIRRMIPANGLAYFASRFLNRDEADEHRTSEVAEIVFNYMGVYQQLERAGSVFKLLPSSTENFGDTASPNMRRFSLFEISAGVFEAEIHFKFAYNRKMKHSTRIQLWVDRCKNILVEAAQLISTTDSEFPVCDTSLINLDYDQSCSLLVDLARRLGLESSDEIEGVYPPSPTQQAMLISQSRYPKCYSTCLALAVRSPNDHVDCNRLRNAWKEVVDRHSILRTVFAQRAPGTTLYDQVILKRTNPNISYVCYTQDAVREPLSLPPALWQAGQPQNKLTICEDSNHCVVCLLEISHALIDHASLPSLFDDFASFYAGDQPCSMRQSYGLLVAHIKSKPQEQAIEYWRSFLRVTEPCHLTFPYAKPFSNGGRLHQFRVPLAQATTSALVTSTIYTPSTVFRLAWALLLRQRTRLPTPVFGYVVSGRDVPIPNVQSMVGPLLNILACCVRIEDTDCLGGLLDKVQKQWLESLPFQHHFLTTAMEDCDQEVPTQRWFNTLVNFRRDAWKAASDQENALQFAALGEKDPWDYDIVVEIDHKISGDFDVVLTTWTHAVMEEDGLELARQYGSWVEAVAEGMLGRKIDLAFDLQV